MPATKAIRIKCLSMKFNLALILCIASIKDSISQNIISLQISPQLEEHGDRWGIACNGKKSDLRLAVFGPFAVTELEKLDSGAFKSKVKEEKGGSYSSGEGYDEYKVRRLEKNIFFRMGVASEKDSSFSLFSVYTEKRKKQRPFWECSLAKMNHQEALKYLVKENRRKE